MRRRRPAPLGKQLTTFDPDALQKELGRKQSRAPNSVKASEPRHESVPLPQETPTSRQPHSHAVIGRVLLGHELAADLTEHYQTRPGLKYRPHTSMLIYASEELLSQTYGTNDYHSQLRKTFPEILERSDISTDLLEQNMQASLTHARVRSYPGSIALSFAVTVPLGSDFSQSHFAHERETVRKSVTMDDSLERVHRPLGLSAGIVFTKGKRMSDMPGEAFAPDIPLPREIEFGPVEILYLRNPA